MSSGDRYTVYDEIESFGLWTNISCKLEINASKQQLFTWLSELAILF
jgi:hypothetical protein